MEEPIFPGDLGGGGLGPYVSLTRPPGSESKVPKEAENVATVPAEACSSARW